MKICIIHGWAEGPWQSKRMRLALEKNGFTVTANALTADYIIAHSSGCYLIPPNNHAKIILVVGLPYWPKRSLLVSVLKKLREDMYHTHHSDGLGWWLKKLMHNTWYIVSRPHATYDVITKHTLNNLPQVKPPQTIKLIRNQADTFCHPNIQNLLTDQHYQFITLPGGHDDCWSHPDPYIHNILSSGRKLLRY